MNIDEKAMMILEGMETYMQIDWNLEQWYLDAIKVGLKEIEKKEKEIEDKKHEEEKKRKAQEDNSNNHNEISGRL